MRRSRSAERGQATVELALALPFVVLAMLLVVQVVVVALAQLQVHDVARASARDAAVGSAPAPTDPATSIRTTTAGGTVTAAVRRRVATSVPLVGVLVPDVEVRSSATFRLEG